LASTFDSKFNSTKLRERNNVYLSTSGLPDTETKPSGGGVNTQIVVAAVGAAVGLVLIAVAVWLYVRRRKKRGVSTGGQDIMSEMVNSYSKPGRCPVVASVGRSRAPGRDGASDIASTDG
jgi:LPXTG-motif cell wall-anchored protein